MRPRDERQEGMNWEAATWEGSRRSQIEYWARLSLDEIFAAQEQMAEFARALADAPEPMASESVQTTPGGDTTESQHV